MKVYPHTENLLAPSGYLFNDFRVSVLHCCCWSWPWRPCSCAGTPAARVTVTIFEREPTSSSCGQGGSLDIYPESGQYALETTQLSVQFCKIAHTEGEEMKIMDEHGIVV
jgi:hypothetical protein